MIMFFSFPVRSLERFHARQLKYGCYVRKLLITSGVETWNWDFPLENSNWGNPQSLCSFKMCFYLLIYQPHLSHQTLVVGREIAWQPRSPQGILGGWYICIFHIIPMSRQEAL